MGTTLTRGEFWATETPYGDHSHMEIKDTGYAPSTSWITYTTDDMKIAQLVELVETLFKALKPYIHVIDDRVDIEQRINKLVENNPFSQIQMETEEPEHLDDNLFEL